MNYTVTFVQYHTYNVEANSDSDAEDKAYREFRDDMRSSIANLHYDDVEIECDYDDEEDEDDWDD